MSQAIIQWGFPGGHLSKDPLDCILPTLKKSPRLANYCNQANSYYGWIAQAKPN